MFHIFYMFPYQKGGTCDVLTKFHLTLTWLSSARMHYLFTHVDFDQDTRISKLAWIFDFAFLSRPFSWDDSWESGTCDMSWAIFIPYSTQNSKNTMWL